MGSGALEQKSLANLQKKKSWFCICLAPLQDIFAWQIIYATQVTTMKKADPMRDDRISVDCFFVKTQRLYIFRVEQPNTAAILWTSRIGVLRYLHDLQDTTLSTSRH
jgi:hypothetical protein